ncbi:hypothetical protein SAMN05421810_10154 [Amycolatopsis arida]|uniref:Uncharacterized protein n=1 Tax=Amycolatopsis arida TaxID=587909 RepID=A0A1I5K9L7_9PSEU|nr:hypothetical protein [Amycolatopsis arida]TDX96950.1 hypothetical protein CLV69_10252 [Amycolatopsis arida]SFO81725.1 hypothetical protein SAMN05421810_10154 [Amycolatopsis arida]
MSIQEQAQQLAALAERVPDGQAQAISSDLGNLQQQVHEILGDTSGAQEIQGVVNQAIEQVNNLAAALEQVKQTIATKAQYHQQG